MFRLCAKSRTCSCWGPFASQLRPARVSLHSPRVLNQLWRHRICDLVIRYRRTYVFLACWRTRMQSMGSWKKYVWKIPMAFVRWHLVVCLVYLNRWNMVDWEDSSRKRSFLYAQQKYFRLTLDNNAGAGWCWIDQAYFWERIFFHYSKFSSWSLLILVFLFVDMFALTILYCVLFFYIRIQLKKFRKATSTSEIQSCHETSNWQANLEAGPPDQPIPPKQIITTQTVTVMTEERPIQRPKMKAEPDRAHQRMNQVALTLLFYPVMYICLTMPLVITRVSEFAGNKWGLTSIYVGACIYCCSGFVNVLLYTATRKGIISWDWLFRRRQSTSSDVAPPPPYNPHYPGSHHFCTNSDSTLHLPVGISSKPSMLSIASLTRPSLAAMPESKRSTVSRHDSDSDFDFGFSVCELNLDMLKEGTYS